MRSCIKVLTFFAILAPALTPAMAVALEPEFRRVLRRLPFRAGSSASITTGIFRHQLC